MLDVLVVVAIFKIRLVVYGKFDLIRVFTILHALALVYVDRLENFLSQRECELLSHLDQRVRVRVNRELFRGIGRYVLDHQRILFFAFHFLNLDTGSLEIFATMKP